MKIGYKRVSTIEQNPDRQLEGLELDKVFIECFSGKTAKDRPIFQQMLEFIREGDTLYVHSMDRFARSTKDLINNIEYITKVKKASIVFTSQNIKLSMDEQPLVMLQLHMMAAFYEFELAVIRERSKEGIALAKLKGKYKGRLPIKQEKVDKIYKMIDMGISKAKIARELKISRITCIRYQKKREEELNSSAD